MRKFKTMLALGAMALTGCAQTSSSPSWKDDASEIRIYYSTTSLTTYKEESYVETGNSGIYKSITLKYLENGDSITVEATATFYAAELSYEANGTITTKYTKTRESGEKRRYENCQWVITLK